MAHDYRYFPDPDLLPLNLEQSFVDWVTSGGIATGEPPPDFDFFADPARAPSVHASLWNPLRDTAADDPAMGRAYAQLPPTDEAESQRP